MDTETGGHIDTDVLCKDFLVANLDVDVDVSEFETLFGLKATPLLTRNTSVKFPAADIQGRKRATIRTPVDAAV